MDPRLREDDSMLIDTHCHLTDERFGDVQETLRLAYEAGVENVIIPSTSVEDAKHAVAIAEEYNQYCLVGIHPEEVENGDLQGVSLQEYLQGRLLGEVKKLEEILRSSKRVVGIGEIGLDFYYDKEKKTKEKQVELFRKQIDLAMENNLPVAIHMREAEEEMREELYIFMEKYQNRTDGWKFKLRGQLHCFAGSPEFLNWAVEKGFYISFCGNITYKTAGNLRELLKMVPENRLLLETDSPYLSPVPLRGTVNSPANVKIIAEFVASELGTTAEKIANSTTENTKCLYSLDI